MRKSVLLILLLLLFTGCTVQRKPVTEQPPETETAAAVQPFPHEEETEATEQAAASTIPETPAPEPTVHESEHSLVLIFPQKEVIAESVESAAPAYDLEFFFSDPGVGAYEFSIAPEGSKEWVTLGEDVFAGSCEYARDHNVELSLHKYQINFESSTNGLWKIRVTTRPFMEFRVLDEWHNIPIKDTTTLLYAMLESVSAYPGTSGEQLRHTIIVDQMEFCESCPSEWTD